MLGFLDCNWVGELQLDCNWAVVGGKQMLGFLDAAELHGKSITTVIGLDPQVLPCLHVVTAFPLLLHHHCYRPRAPGHALSLLSASAPLLSASTPLLSASTPRSRPCHNHHFVRLDAASPLLSLLHYHSYCIPTLVRLDPQVTPCQRGGRREGQTESM